MPIHPSYFEDTFGLTGKVAVVTGWAGQLGGEYVNGFLNSGALVAGMDIQTNPGMLDEFKTNKENFFPLQLNVTKKDEVERGLKEILNRFGRVDVLVNNAAIDTPPGASGRDTGPFETYPETSWDAMQEVNLKGVFICSQIIGGYMAQNGGGSIINISSIYGMLSPDQRIYRGMNRKTPFVKPVAYSVTKGGVINLTRYLAGYWGSKNVRVNTLTLGGVFNQQDESFVNHYSDRVPLGRMARKDEYTGAILFLASDASSYMTGANLVIDGGYNCW